MNIGESLKNGSLVREAARFRAAQWRTLMATMFCYLFFYTGRQTFGFAIPGIQDELGISKATLGWASAALLWANRSVEIWATSLAVGGYIRSARTNRCLRNSSR